MNPLHEFASYFASPRNFRAALPQVWEGFQTSIKMMIVAEILVLVFALTLAIIRGLPGRAAAPLRVAAAGYTDFFRGRPGILVIFLLGFGHAEHSAPGLPQRRRSSAASVALTLRVRGVRGRGVPRRHRWVHSSQAAAARSLGLSLRQTMRYVVLPQAIRRVVPPLLNDFIGLQKDTALVRSLGVVEASAGRRSTHGHLTSRRTVVAGAVLPRDHDPAGAPHRLRCSQREQRGNAGAAG